MRERPDGRDLLITARKVLRERILPKLDPALRHEMLMVLNALSIAERQMAAGEAPIAAETVELSALLGAPVDDLVAANRRLVEWIRAGAADPGAEARAAILAHLRVVGRARLAESNPKVLGPAG